MLLAAALALVSLAHAPGLDGGFVWDDRVLILESSAPALASHFTETFWTRSPQGEALAYYRPVTSLSFALDETLWSGAPGGFHTTNLLLHLLCCALLFALCRRVGAPPIAAAFAAALFGVLPRLTESVSWISGRSDVLAALGTLGALALHRSEPHGGPRRALAAAALLFGLLAKETAAAGAVALVACEVARCRDGSPAVRPVRAVRNLVPALGACALYLGLRLASGAEALGAEHLPLSERGLVALEALGRYAGMLLDPLRPRVQIGLLGVTHWGWTAAGAGVLVAMLALGTRAWRRRWPAEVLAALSFAAAALLPTLHLLPLPIGVVAADRLLYLPALGAAIALAWRASQLEGGRARAAAAAAAFALAAFLPATALRARSWTDEVGFWETAALRAHPLNSRPTQLLGEALLRAGRPALALEASKRSLRINASFRRERPWADSRGLILGNIAGALSALGRDREALEVMRELVSRDPLDPKHRYNLGVIYGRLLRFDASLAALDRALLLRPHWERAAAARRAVAEARDIWRELPPEAAGEDRAMALARAEAYARIGRRADARRLREPVPRAPAAAAR